MVDEQNEGEFYAVLDRLSDRLWEECKDLPRYGYGKEDKITRYHVLRSAHGPGVAKAYLEQNLDVDEFRLILVRSGGSGPANGSICSMKSIEAGDSGRSGSVRPAGWPC